MKTFPFLGLIFAGAMFAADRPIPPVVAPDISEAVKQYGTYRQMLPEPKSIAAQQAILCRSIPEDKQYGPHSRHYVQHFRNPIAMEAKDAKTWPVGSILIKEKLSLEHSNIKLAKPTIQGVAGMIKRAPGTHPKSGDWEFFWAQEGKVETAKMESCAGCHSGAARDYVFTTFPEKKEK